MKTSGNLYVTFVVAFIIGLFTQCNNNIKNESEANPDLSGSAEKVQESKNELAGKLNKRMVEVESEMQALESQMNEELGRGIDPQTKEVYDELEDLKKTLKDQLTEVKNASSEELGELEQEVENTFQAVGQELHRINQKIQSINMGNNKS